MNHDPVDRGPRATPPRCPRCRGALERVHRHAADHSVAAAQRRTLYRYRCRSAACHWSGLLAPVTASGRHGGRSLVAGVAVMLAVAAAAVGLVIGLPTWWDSPDGAKSAAKPRAAGVQPLPQDVVTVPPAGWHAVGQALPRDDARQAGRAAGLQLRHGCTWGVPGADPYRGTAEQALQAAGLPAEAVRVLAQRIRRGESDGDLTLARDGIQSADGQRLFDRRLVASTHGMTLCFDTLVNFAEGHVERAPLFEFTSADGRLFSVIVPEVCGNVSVVSELPPAGIVLGERAERPPTPAARGITDTVAPPATPGFAQGRAEAAHGRTHTRAPAAGTVSRPAVPAVPRRAGTPEPRDTTPTQPSPPGTPHSPPSLPPELPPWLPVAPPWVEDIVPLPPAGPTDFAPPRPVPAPGTLPTTLLGLAALMVSRRWYRRQTG